MLPVSAHPELRAVPVYFASSLPQIPLTHTRLPKHTAGNSRACCFARQLSCLPVYQATLVLAGLQGNSEPASTRGGRNEELTHRTPPNPWPATFIELDAPLQGQ